jgi:ABC-type multidrug transport system fused ATPase/permease subunit
MSPFWTFARRMLRYRALLAGAAAMACVSAGSLGAGLVGLKPVLDSVFGREHKGLPELAESLNATPLVHGAIPGAWIDALPAGPYTALVSIMVLLGVLTIIGATANFLHVYLSLTIVNRSVTAIRRGIFHRVVRMPLAAVLATGAPDGSTGGAADAVSRIINDCGQLGQGLNALLSKGVAQVTKGLAALAAAVLIDWRLTVAAVPLAIIVGAVIKKLGTKIRRASRSALVSQSDLYLATSESLQGLRVVKVHGAERFEAGRFHRINKQVMRELNRVRTARALASPVIELIAVFVVGVTVLVAGRAIIDNKLDPQSFIAAFGALAIAGGSLKPLVGILNDIQASAGAADRLAEIDRTRPEPGHDNKLPKLPRHSESIEFRAVTFHYPRTNRPSLSQVSVRIRHGETVAFVGPNGSGKTTLLALVPRLFDPDSGAGQVLVDGKDIRLFNVRSLRRQIGVVTQETVLFKGTVRGNIAYGAENVTEERILAAAKQSRAHDFITALPKGYDSPIGEQGLTLSGGQRQRLAIARAILRDPAILILDEATSMIDADSEAHIAQSLHEFAKGRTCLVVAHRLSTVINADRIVVMDAGKVVDTGKHSELLARCDVYRTIASRQLIGGSLG